MRDLPPPARGQPPVLALDVVDDCGTGPGEQSRDDQADALAAPRWGEGQDVLRPVMAQIPAAETAEEDTRRPEQPRRLDLSLRRPARGTVGGDHPALPRPPQRANNADGAARESAGCRDRARPIEHFRRVGVVGVPPLEEPPGVIDGNAEQREPWRAQPRLKPKLGGAPLRREPHTRDDDRKDNEDLADEDLGRGRFRCLRRSARPRPDLERRIRQTAGKRNRLYLRPGTFMRAHIYQADLSAVGRI